MKETYGGVEPGPIRGADKGFGGDQGAWRASLGRDGGCLRRPGVFAEPQLSLDSSRRQGDSDLRTPLKRTTFSRSEIADRCQATATRRWSNT